MSEIQIQKIGNPIAWNGFLRKLAPNTFLQTWQWGELQKHIGEGVRYLGFFSGEEQRGAALLLTVNAKRGRFLFCPHGPLFASEEETRKYLPDFIEHCRKLAQQDKACALRLAPLLVTSPENTALFQQLGFRSSPIHMHTELTWVLDITKSEEELLRGMRKTTRQAIKKAKENGVMIEIHRDIQVLDRFLPLYQTTEKRHGFVPFRRDFLEKQLNLFLKDNLGYVAVARYQNQDVAAAILMQLGNTVFYHHGASVKLPSNVSAAQLLQWEAIREAKRRGAIRYNFWGIAPKDQPKHPFTGITVFKKGFGGYAIDYMHAQDISLSSGYWKLWLVDTYRKFKRGF